MTTTCTNHIQRFTDYTVLIYIDKKYINYWQNYVNQKSVSAHTILIFIYINKPSLQKESMFYISPHDHVAHCSDTPTCNSSYQCNYTDRIKTLLVLEHGYHQTQSAQLVGICALDKRYSSVRLSCIF